MKNLINTEIIEKYLKENNLPKLKFCNICKISPSTFKRILTNKNVKMDALFKIARTLNIDLCQMFNNSKKT